MAKVQIILNHTPRSHVLLGEALKDTYADFRIKVLREVEWATWHTRLRLTEATGGTNNKGWCIRKANLPDLENELAKYCIPYESVEYHPNGFSNWKLVAASDSKEQRFPKSVQKEQVTFDLTKKYTCTNCLEIFFEYKFTSINGPVCLPCKIKLGSEIILRAPFADKWLEIPQNYASPLVQDLKDFYGAVKKTGVGTILGNEVDQLYFTTYLSELLRFIELGAFEWGGLEFATTRFREYFKNKEYIMDFWYTLCNAYELHSYLSDLSSANLI